MFGSILSVVDCEDLRVLAYFVNLFDLRKLEFQTLS